MNIVCLAGNVSRDIDLRTTQSGKKVANFSLAINESKDHTEFVNCIAWEKTADLINQYVKKGDRLALSGKLQTRKWEDQQGQTRYATEVIVDRFDFPPKTKGEPVAGSAPEHIEDEIPFAPVNIWAL